MLFFYNEKSRYCNEIIGILEQINPSKLEMICANTPEVRDILLNDETYGITDIPSLLIIYVNGDHHVLSRAKLDEWLAVIVGNYNQMVQAAEEEAQQQQQFPMGVNDQPVPISSTGPPPIGGPPPVSQPPEAPHVTRTPPGGEHVLSDEPVSLIDLSETPESVKKVKEADPDAKISVSAVLGNMKKQREELEAQMAPQPQMTQSDVRPM